MRLLLWGAAAGLVLLPLLADARMHHPARGHRMVSAGAPLDGFTTPTGAYSFRKLKSTYAGPGIRIRRASDNAELDINFLGCTGFTGCPWDEAAANAHCAATSCFGVTVYDQSGGARHMTQATAASQPALVFNCNGTLPCLRLTLGGHALSFAGYTPGSTTMSFGTVGKRAAGTGVCYFMRAGANNRLSSINGVANGWQLFATTGIKIDATGVADNVWHAAQGSMTGATSALNIDGTVTTGTVTGDLVAGAIVVQGSATTTCDWAESMVWDGYGTTAGEKTALIGNQRGYYGTP